jgi:hypothetical protein
MTKFLPSGWDEDRVKEGLYKAMGFGEPTRTQDQAAFHIPTASGAAVAGNSEGVPWDPTVKRVACAIEFQDSLGQTTTAGDVQATQVVVTLLDPEYQQVKGFDYVVAGGDKYYYRLTDPPVALGSIDVWTVRARSLDER